MVWLLVAQETTGSRLATTVIAGTGGGSRTFNGEPIKNCEKGSSRVGLPVENRRAFTQRMKPVNGKTRWLSRFVCAGIGGDSLMYRIDSGNVQSSAWR